MGRLDLRLAEVGTAVRCGAARIARVALGVVGVKTLAAVTTCVSGWSFHEFRDGVWVELRRALHFSSLAPC